jgi:hypothetical protein
MIRFDTKNPRVAGSIPALATIQFSRLRESGAIALGRFESQFQIRAHRD